jgi:hypothetical protein
MTSRPEQVHLALAGPGEMVVIWVTNGASLNSTLKYNLHGEKTVRVAEGTLRTYDVGKEGNPPSLPPPPPPMSAGWHGEIHVVRLAGLELGAAYEFVVGDAQKNEWSESLSFNVPHADPQVPPPSPS